MQLTAVYIVSMDPYGNSGMILKKKKGYDDIAHIKQSVLGFRYNIKSVRCIKC